MGARRGSAQVEVVLEPLPQPEVLSQGDGQEKPGLGHKVGDRRRGPPDALKCGMMHASKRCSLAGVDWSPNNTITAALSVFSLSTPYSKAVPAPWIQAYRNSEVRENAAHGFSSPRVSSVRSQPAPSPGPGSAVALSGSLCLRLDRYRAD